jgi:hypothetical protein
MLHSLMPPVERWSRANSGFTAVKGATKTSRPVESVLAQPIATSCPLCGERRRYLPTEVFLGRLSHLLKEGKKPALEGFKRITIWELLARPCWRWVKVGWRPAARVSR